MRRRRPGITVSPAGRGRVLALLVVLALAGCATIQPMSLRDARRHGSPAQAPDVQAISGYFDAHGEFHEFRGYARVVGDHVELFRLPPPTPPSAWSVRGHAAQEAAGARADSVRTLIVLRYRTGLHIAAFLAGAAAVMGGLAVAY